MNIILYSTPMRVLLTVILLSACHTVNALNFKIDNIYYDSIAPHEVQVMPHIEDNTVYSDYAGDIVIPDNVTYNGVTYGVTRVCEYTFYGCTDLASVKLPNTLKSIGEYAMAYCTGITKLTLPEGLERIGVSAFSYTPIKSLTIPASCVWLGYDNVSSPNENLPAMVMNGMTELTELKVAAGNPYMSARDNVLYTKSGKSLLYCPECLVDNEFTVPIDVDSIESFAFMRTQIRKVNIPSNIKFMASTAFVSAISLESLRIDDGITTLNIRPHMWVSQRNELGNGTLRDLYIGRNIDGGFTKLTDENCFTLTLGSQALEGVNPYFMMLNEYVDAYAVADGVDGYHVSDGALYRGTAIMAWPCKAPMTELVTLESGCTEIMANAFASAQNIGEVSVPETVTTIGDGAFRQSSLKSISLGNKIAFLGTGFCEGCTALESARVMSGTISDNGATNGIPDNAFKGCNAMQTLYYGARINYVGASALSQARVTHIYMANPTPPQYKSYSMGLASGIARAATLYVPTGSKSAYADYIGNRYFINIEEFDVAGIDGVYQDKDISVVSTGSGIEIIGASEDAVVEIYTTGGRMVYSGVGRSISLPGGLYLLRIGAHARKVLI